MEKVDSKYQVALVEVADAILERAFEAVKTRDSKKEGTSVFDYQSGRVMGFNESISLIKLLAEGFDIDLKEIGLDKVDPDNDLV